jgi:hypothetical protein
MTLPTGRRSPGQQQPRGVTNRPAKMRRGRIHRQQKITTLYSLGLLEKISLVWNVISRLQQNEIHLPLQDRSTKVFQLI